MYFVFAVAGVGAGVSISHFGVLYGYGVSVLVVVAALGWGLFRLKVEPVVSFKQLVDKFGESFKEGETN